MNFFFVIDDNYTTQCMVTLNSIFKNNGGGHRIYIYSPELSKDNYNALDQFIRNNSSEMLFRMESSIGFDLTLMATTQWNPIVFYKLYGMLDIKDVDKILYLDCDIIVNSNLTELYDIDLEERYAAVVEDVGVPQAFPEPTYYMNRIGLKSEHEYFNAGVMLLNLRMIQKNMSMELFLSTYYKWHNVFHYNEQDLLNMLWNGNLIYVEKKYNRIATDYAYRNKIDDDKTVAIYHYTMNKPWQEGGGSLLEEKDYQWCVNVYLKYCDFPEAKELNDKVTKINSNTELINLSNSKRECGFNPFMIIDNSKESDQKRLLVKTVGQEAMAERALGMQLYINRQNDIMDFLIRLNERGSLGAKMYFSDRGINKIAVYGLGKVCKFVEKELCAAAEVICFTDKNKTSDIHIVSGKEYPVYSTDDVRVNIADAIVVTSIGYWKDIVKSIEKVYGLNKLIAIENILFESDRL